MGTGKKRVELSGAVREAVDRSNSYVGQKMRKKKENRIRLLLSNIGGLVGERLEEKKVGLKELFIQSEIDVVAITELGQNEKRIQEKETLRELTRGWSETMATRTATNHHFDSGQKRLYGGTGLIVANELASRIIKTEKDPTGLGRWVSTLLQGKQGFRTRIISAYRPCWSSSEGSVNMQHHLYFADANVDPRKQFIEDLQEAIVNWQNQGELIILSGDMNTGDKADKKSLDRFWAPFLLNTGLIDAHKSHLKVDWLPNTQARGKVQIDFIFVSPAIEIKRCGFLPFTAIPSDHRGLWIDFSVQSILGLFPPPLQKFQARRLKLIDPRVVERYQNILLNLIEAYNLPQQIEEIQAIPQNEWTNGYREKYQTISVLYRELMIKAERGCRRIFKGAHSWSPEFQVARKKYILWTLVMKHCNGEKVAVKKILALKNQLKIKSTKVSLEVARYNLQQAKQEYVSVKHKSKRLRESYLEDLASALATSNNSKKSSQIKALLDREKTREMFRKIKIARGRFQKDSFSTVTIRDSSGNRRVLSDKAEIEEQIMRTNKGKFRQTEGCCSLMMEPLRHQFGTTANTISSSEVTKGEYQINPECSSATKAFLSMCAQAEETESIVELMSLEEYRIRWARAKERTSAGEAHFGMWKAGARHKELSRLEWILSTIPFRNGFSPEVWKTATDVMILKASGNTDLDALRTVVLYEADFNFVNKQIGRLAVDNAIKSGIMVEEQFAKKGSSPIDQSVCRRIVFDLVRFQRSALVVCSTDLLSCYDRIVHSAASLAMQSVGIPMEVMHAMFSTIQGCRHKVRTGLGTSSRTYGGIVQGEDPLMGVGQGNGAGPSIWAILSCILFRIMHEQNMSTTFTAKLSEALVNLVGFMYVDDNDLIISGTSNKKEELIRVSQKRLSTWNKLIKETGGAIRMDKSNWYGYYHEWNETEGSYNIQDIRSHSLSARDHKGKKVQIPQLTWSASQKILGHLTSPSGDSSHQVKHLIRISEEESKLISKSRLSPTECKIAILHTIFPKISYVLTATTISKEDSRRIMRPLLDACLPRMGIVKTLGYDYTYGSRQLLGLGIPEPYHVSFASQLEFILHNIWKQTVAGKLILMESQEIAIELGVEDPFHQPRTSRIWEGLLTPNSWIAPICDYINEQGIKLRFPSWSKSRLIREDDRYIMEEIATLSKYEMSKKEFKAFNFCRLFKRVHSMAEILDSSGKGIADRAWNRDRFNRGAKAEFNDQQHPTERQWESWKKGLRALQRKYRYNLGRWTAPKEEEESWDFFVDHTNRQLMLKENSKWYSFETLNRRWTGILKFSLEPRREVDPRDVTLFHRATVKFQDHWIELESTTCQSVTPHPTFTSLHKLIQSIPPIPQDTDFQSWFRNTSELLPETSWAFERIRFKGNMENLIQDFIQGKSRLVGDGSYKEGIGAGASLISTGDGKDYIIVSGQTPGEAESQNPYRSEVGSLVGCSLLRLLLVIATKSYPKVTLACDNEKALRKVQPKSMKIKPSTKHSDLISVMTDIWNSCEGEIILEDVKGHADEEKEDSSLTVMERLNTLVDKAAKERRSQIQDNIHRKFSPLVGIGMIIINDIPTTDNHANKVQAHAARQRSHAALTRIRKIHRQYLPLIDEYNMSAAMEGIPIKRQLFLSKWCAKQLPVGKTLKQRNHSLTDTCPLCLEVTEDHNHLLQCESMSALNKFDEVLAHFETRLESLDTSPTLQMHLIDTLRLWRQVGSNSHLSRVYPSSIQNKIMFQPFAEQEKIGWENFFLGIISSQWAKAQQSYIDTVNITKKTGKIWAKQMIRALWDLDFEIWNHRNERVHTSQDTMEMTQGVTFLNEAIEKEYSLGPQALHRDFRYTFTRQSLQELLAKPVKEKKTWFHTIRTAREKTNTAIPDVFSINGPLRSWTGLPRIKN
jgi:exonuclease III